MVPSAIPEGRTACAAQQLLRALKKEFYNSQNGSSTVSDESQKVKKSGGKRKAAKVLELDEEEDEIQDISKKIKTEPVEVEDDFAL